MFMINPSLLMLGYLLIGMRQRQIRAMDDRDGRAEIRRTT